MADRPENRISDTPEHFSDAYYNAASELPNTPRVYPTEDAYGLFGIPTGTVMALCLALILLGVGLVAVSRQEAPPPESYVPVSVPTPLPAPTPTPFAALSERPELTEEEILSIARQQVVTTMAGEELHRGMGAVISPDGYILTGMDAVAPGEEAKILLPDGRELGAAYLGWDGHETRLALLKIEAEGLRSVVLGGETEGILYALQTAETGEGFSLLPGSLEGELFRPEKGRITHNSPLFNRRGELVGAVQFTDGRPLFLSLEEAGAIAEEIIAYGCVRASSELGIRTQTVTEALAEYYNRFNGNIAVTGARVYAVNTGSGADLAGLLPGDIVVALNDSPIRTSGELQALEAGLRAGDTVSVTVLRAGEYCTLEVTLCPPAEEQEDFYDCF